MRFSELEALIESELDGRLLTESFARGSRGKKGTDVVSTTFLGTPDELFSILAKVVSECSACYTDKRRYLFTIKGYQLSGAKARKCYSQVTEELRKQEAFGETETEYMSTPNGGWTVVTLERFLEDPDSYAYVSGILIEEKAVGGYKVTFSLTVGHTKRWFARDPVWKGRGKCESWSLDVEMPWNKMTDGLKAAVYKAFLKEYDQSANIR